jgi:hypothetical protein
MGQLAFPLPQAIGCVLTDTVVFKDSFENYTQTAHWGAESFLFFSGNTDPSQQQAPLDNSLFPYGQDPTGTS